MGIAFWKFQPHSAPFNLPLHTPFLLWATVSFLFQWESHWSHGNPLIPIPMHSSSLYLKNSSETTRMEEWEIYTSVVQLRDWTWKKINRICMYYVARLQTQFFGGQRVGLTCDQIREASERLGCLFSWWLYYIILLHYTPIMNLRCDESFRQFLSHNV